MQKNLDNFYHVFSTLVGMLVLIITFTVIIDIVGRNLANKPLTGTVDISRLLLSLILFLGLAYAQRTGAHVRITLFYRYLPSRVVQLMEVIVFAGGLFLLSFLAYSSWVLFYDSWLIKEVMVAPIELPQWLAKLALFIGSVLFAVQFGIDLMDSVRKLRRRSI